MKLYVIRTQHGSDATNGLLYVETEIEAYTLEDQVRDGAKVMSETAIPLGTYEIKFRNIGGYDSKYRSRYGTDWHRGMLELQDVPNFKYILIHTGNTDSHTSGCLLIGETQQDLDKGKDGFIGGSGDAYKKFYPKVRDALLAGEKVTIQYTTIKDLLEKKASNASTDDVILTKTVMEKLEEISGEVQIITAKLNKRTIS